MKYIRALTLTRNLLISLLFSASTGLFFSFFFFSFWPTEGSMESEHSFRRLVLVTDYLIFQSSQCRLIYELEHSTVTILNFFDKLVGA